MSAILEKNIVPRIETQVPEHLRDDYPIFLAFLKAYYEYMGSDSNAMAAARRLPEDTDVDITLEKFIEYFKKEFLVSLPRDVLADKRLLLKHAREFYRTRGSEASYKFLFRSLFNDDIDFYYPGEDILRASDGRYEISKSIKLANIAGGEAAAFDGVLVIGQTSGARARVVSFLEGEVSGIRVVEIRVSNIQGVFEDGENVLSEDGVLSGTILNTVGPVATIATVRIPGAFHTSGDVVNIIDAGNGQGANGFVASIDDQSAVYFTINNGGSGYRANSIVSIVHSGGVGANFRIDEINNLETLAGLNTDRIGPYAAIQLNTGGSSTAWRGFAGANTAAMNATMSVTNVNSTFNDAFSYASLETGSIKKITTTNFGYGYTNLPSAEISDPFVASFKVNSSANPGLYKGEDAVITVNRAPGSITAVTINEQGKDYSKFRDVFLRNVTKGSSNGGYVSDTVDGNTPPTTAQDGTGEPGIFGIIDNPGVFTDTKGFLSWNNKIQDNYFYQEYSYALKTTKNINEFRDIVKRLLHPAGTKMFNLFQVTPVVDASAGLNQSNLITFAPKFQFESQINAFVDVIYDTDQSGSPIEEAVELNIRRNYAQATGSANSELVVQPPLASVPDRSIVNRIIERPALTIVPTVVDEREVEIEVETLEATYVVSLGVPTTETRLTVIPEVDIATTQISFSNEIRVTQEKLGTTTVPTVSDEREIEVETQTLGAAQVITLGVPTVSSFVLPTLEIAPVVPFTVIPSNNEFGFFGAALVPIQGTGTLFNRTDEQISSFLSNTPDANDLGNIEIGALGGSKLVYGNNTIFTSQLSEGQSFIITANTTNSSLPSGTANNIVTANVIYSDTLVAIKSTYPYYPLSNTEFFIYS